MIFVEIAGEDGYFKCEWEEDTSRFVLNGDGLTVDFDNYYGYECEVIMLCIALANKGF